MSDRIIDCPVKVMLSVWDCAHAAPPMPDTIAIKAAVPRSRLHARRPAICALLQAGTLGHESYPVFCRRSPGRWRPDQAARLAQIALRAQILIQLAGLLVIGVPFRVLVEHVVGEAAHAIGRTVLFVGLNDDVHIFDHALILPELESCAAAA